ncbi:MAG: hypothetical protein GY842_23740 [bacterium]|nr:hypothetical protein [bacterium]
MFSKNTGRARLRLFLPRKALLVAVTVCGAACAVAAPPRVTGSLETVQGIRVLRLWGTAYERGYAHGFLVGDDVVELFNSAVLDPRVLKDPTQYETVVRGEFAAKMNFDPERREELRGMLDGIVASVGPSGIRLARLGRNLDVEDLAAINSLADWHRFLCSSFSAWGDAEGGTEMITARNLDFLTLPGLDTKHLLIVYLDPGLNRRRWVSLAWSGLIGAYTAMNEEGVTISMHDAPGRQATVPGPFVPRSIALRDALEQATASNAVADVHRILLTRPAICGNNIHVSAPFANQPRPAAVLEYDGDASLDGGVTVRTSHAVPLPNWIACTNHYLKRQPAKAIWEDSKQRHTTIEQALRAARQRHTKLDPAFARGVMAEVSRRGTLQTVVFFPNRKEWSFSLAPPGANALASPPVLLHMDALLRK